MYAHVQKTQRFSITLEEGEQFEWETPTGRIMVNYIHFDEHTHERSAVTFRGWAIRSKDGSQGSIQRSGVAGLRDVPQEVLLYAVATLRNIKMEGKDVLEGS